MRRNTYNLRTSQAAALIGVDDETIRTYVRKGHLLGRRLPSGQLRFSIAELLPFMPEETAAKYLDPEPSEDA